MLIFKFAGHLRRHIRQIEMNVETPAQGLRILIAQSDGLKKAMLTSKVRLRLAGEEIEESSLQWHMDRHLKDGSTVLFVPIVEGAGIEIGVAGWIAISIAAASVAYSIYSARSMKPRTSAEAAQSNSITNNSFTSAENRVGQGRPVPILLGEMVVGSNVASLGIDTSNNQDWSESIS